VKAELEMKHGVVPLPRDFCAWPLALRPPSTYVQLPATPPAHPLAAVQMGRAQGSYGGIQCTLINWICSQKRANPTCRQNPVCALSPRPPHLSPTQPSRAPRAEKGPGRPAPPHARDLDKPMASEPTLGTLAALATDAEASAAFASAAALGEEADSGAGTGAAQTREQARRHHVRALHKVLEETDSIPLVLNNRDPDDCRSRLVEEEVRRREADGKRLVFVLNKIGMHLPSIYPSLPHVFHPLVRSDVPTDLVTKENGQVWLRHLRHSTPTLPFRSASNGQRSNLSSAAAPALMRLLKAFKPSARSATVGVVG
jgi:nuclear GTP-binding protein